VRWIKISSGIQQLEEQHPRLIPEVTEEIVEEVLPKIPVRAIREGRRIYERITKHIKNGAHVDVGRDCAQRLVNRGGPYPELEEWFSVEVQDEVFFAAARDLLPNWVIDDTDPEARAAKDCRPKRETKRAAAMNHIREIYPNGTAGIKTKDIQIELEARGINVSRYTIMRARKDLRSLN
jgi:hypothetical protein